MAAGCGLRAAGCVLRASAQACFGCTTCQSRPSTTLWRLERATFWNLRGSVDGKSDCATKTLHPILHCERSGWTCLPNWIDLSVKSMVKKTSLSTPQLQQQERRTTHMRKDAHAQDLPRLQA